jgi:hypothetical protein
VRDGDERFGIERSEKLDIKKKSKVHTSRQIEESISIPDFFPPNRGVDFYCRILPPEH